jgi:hypothetical protein
VTEQSPPETRRFGVVAEVDGRQQQLVMLNLPFGRLIDEVVVPYDSDESFFIDGVPVTRKTVRRIKIIALGSEFAHGLRALEIGLTRADHQTRKIYGDQYETRFEHLLRTAAEDVTPQVLKAYNQAVKPKLRDYIPKRDELISAATTIFVEAMKTLSR